MTKEETKEFCRDWGIKDVNAFEKYEKYNEASEYTNLHKKKLLIDFLNENKISLGLEHPDTELRWVNSTKEYGRFATADLAVDEIIYHLGGFWISWETKKSYNKDYFQGIEGHYYWQGGLSPELNASCNHSCDPNTYMEDNNSIRALRDIHKDEELTIDYSTFINHDFIIFAECGCGSKHCRKQVTGKDWLIHKLPLKYNYKVSQRIIIKWLHYLNTNALPEQHAAVECYLHD